MSAAEAFLERGQGTSALASILIVNYFKAPRLIESLESLRKQQLDGYLDIVVVDNSCDARERSLLLGAREHFKFTLIFADDNIGYTRGCNLAFRYALPSEFVVLQNPDILWRNSAGLMRLVRLMSAHDKLGIVGPDQINDDGSPAEVIRQFPAAAQLLMRRISLFGRASEFSLLKRELGTQRVIFADWLQSSCVVMRREFWKKVGGLDERYFLFMSDIDICAMAWRNGFEVGLVPDVAVQADGRRASAGVLWKAFFTKTIRIHIRDAIRYFLKNGLRPLNRSYISASATAGSLLSPK